MLNTLLWITAWRTYVYHPFECLINHIAAVSGYTLCLAMHPSNHVLRKHISYDNIYQAVPWLITFFFPIRVVSTRSWNCVSFSVEYSFEYSFRAISNKCVVNSSQTSPRREPVIKKPFPCDLAIMHFMEVRLSDETWYHFWILFSSFIPPRAFNEAGVLLFIHK